MAIVPIRRPWKGEMTARERFYNQMHYKPIDRTFNMEFGYWDENFTLWKLFTENGIRNNAEADIFFAFDRFDHVGGVHWMHPAFPEEIIGETETHVIRRNGDGVKFEQSKKGGSIPKYLGASVVTPDDWMKVKKERFAVDDPARTLDVKALAERYPESRGFPVSVNTGSMIGMIRNMLTFEGLAYACYDYPEMVEDMVETCCRLVEHSLDQLLPAIRFDAAEGWEDICFNHGPIVTVPFFRDVVMPRYKRINKKLKAYGIDIWWCDCDGDVRPILPYFMEGGINCLFPYEVNSCAHPAELLRDNGLELRIMGGVDKMQLGKGREAIDAYLDTLIPLVKRGGYIPFCDHRCPPNVKEEDYIYYLDRKEELFGMK